MDAGATFGKCPCGGSYETQMIPVYLTVGPVEGVPMGHCPNCDSRVYKAAALQRVEAATYGKPVEPRLMRRPI